MVIPFLVPTRSSLILPGIFPAGKILVGAGGSAPRLSETESVKLQLGQSFASIQQINSSCIAIMNTSFTAPSPEPEWFNGLNKNLKTLKDHAKTWNDDYAVAIQSTVPSTVMSFVPTFDTSAEALLSIAGANPGTLTPSEAETARKMFGRMVEKTEEILRKVNRYVVEKDGKSTGLLIDWMKDMRNARDALQAGSSSIQKAQASLEKEISEFNGKIERLERDIEDYYKMVGLGAGLIGGGLVVGAIGGALCFSFPIVGGIVIFLGVGAAVGGAVTWGVMADKIDQANAEILEYREKIRTNNTGIAALRALSSASNLALSSADIATKNLLSMSATWLTFGDALRDTMSKLENGSEQVTGTDLGVELKDAIKSWDDVKSYAKDLQSVPADVSVVPAGKKTA